MKTFLRRLSACGGILLALFAGPAAQAAAPSSVVINSPLNGQNLGTVTSPAGVDFNATATSSSAAATIVSLDFRVNGTSIGTVSGGTATVTGSVAWFPTTPGTYTLTVVATDSTGSPNTLTSAAAIVTVSAARVATVIAPPANSTVTQNSSLFLRSTAVMTDGVVSRVDFLLDGATVIGSATSAPYNAAATIAAAPGSHTIVARATASDGATTFDSAPVTFTVVTAVGTGPTVSITSPAGGTSVPVGSSITITATASDADGFIPNTSPGGVTFYADGEPIGTDLSAPYSITWVPNVAKSYSLRALATDDKANTQLSAPVTVTAIVSSAASVALTAPPAGRITSVGAPVSLAATANPSTGATITAVEFLAGSTVVASTSTAPYTATWTPTAAGTISLSARATDSSGAVVTTTPVSITVASAPTVTLASPGATLAAGAAVTLTATATVGTGLTNAGVQFFANGVAIGTDADAPYSISWTPTTAGNVALTARVTDSAGAAATSPPVNVTVTGSATALTVSLALTGSSAIPVGSTRVLNATTSGGAAVDRVELLLNGTTLVATDNSAPYTFLFNASAPVGAQFLIARAIDATGNEAASAAVPITITNPIGTPPAIALVAPASGAFLVAGTTTTVTGTATDADGTVTGVQVFVNGATAGLANSGAATISGSTWSIAWTPNATGTASITAIATDNNGNAVGSSAVGVNVTDNTSPAITVTLSPRTAAAGASATMPSGAVRNLVADVTPASGRAVVRVEFFVDGTKVGEDTAAPYTYRYVAPPLATDQQSRTFILTARATDNAGAARDVQVPLSVIRPIGEPPTVSLLTPATNASVAPGTSVSLAATAVANGGSIASVQFYVNGNAAPMNGGNAITTAPYVTTFTPTAPGTYTIDAIATDDRGNTTVSNSATITAAFATPTVTITSPNPNATARATPNVPLNLAATAVVQAGGGAAVLLVEFLLDGVQIGADTTAPYTFAWTPTIAQLGPHVITARVTDINGQTATSAPVNVNVATVTGTPPTISITQPSSGGGVGQTGNLQSLSKVNFVANTSSAAPGVTISGVEFFLNDVSIGTAAREQSTNLWRLAYDLSRFDFSNAPSTTDPNTGAVRYTPVPLYAIARDSNNNQTVTNPINLTINTSTSLPPSIQIPATTPTTITQGQQFLMLASFNDPDGTVTQLQVFANGIATATVTNPQPNTTLTYVGNNPGRFNIYVVATDDTGNTSVSSPAIPVTVNAVAAPGTTITRPANDATMTTVGAPVFLEGTATSSDPTQIPTLSFIATAAGNARTTIPAQRVGTTTTYRAVWTPTTPGNYSVSTQATIGTTAQSTSAVSRRVVVTNLQGLAPSVTISVPNSVTTASQSNLTATATDSDGSVVEVEFFVNRNSIGNAVRDQLANTWRLTASFAGVLPGTAEIVALARDSSGNVAASPTSNISVTAAASIAPSITITPSTTNAAFNRQVQLRANARDTDGTVNSVQYFANGTSIGTSTNSGTSFQVNWTPNQSGTFNVWAVATDNTGITTVAPTVEVTVRANNPVLEDAAFVLQTYQDIANTTNINPLVFDDLDARLAAGTLSRAEVVASLVTHPGFVAPVNLLAAYHVIMGQWPTPANYNALIGTARNSLANAVGAILNSNEYFAKFGVVPTTQLLDNPASAIPAEQFLNRLYQTAGLGTPSALNRVQFRSNNVATPTLGRGYAVSGLNTALAEFITNTNSTNTALFNKARAAALFYQLNRPPVTVTVDQITERVAALAQLPDAKAIADAALKDVLYTYRYVTITKQPTSITVAPRSGVLFSVDAIGAPPLAYQWLLNGAPIAGATSALLSLTNVDTTRVGTYTAVVTSSVASSTSDPATLTLSTTPTRLANISTRGVTTSTGANVLIGGFVVTGTGNQTRQMLIRVVGPSLAGAPFNVSGFLPDPRLEVYSGSNANPVLTNDNWGNQTGGNAQVNAIRQATTRAGAFALAAANSADAVVLATLPPGQYTVQAKGPANNPNASGVVLIEVYDVTPGTGAGPKAANVSTRGLVGTGGNILIAGFVVNGGVSRRMLIRGAGPTLTQFGLGANAVLADPQLTLVDQATGRTIATNDDWAAGEEAGIIAVASRAAGAFPLRTGSKDAAIIIMLPPGAYTAQLRGANNGTGIGIVEVYDVDP